jgi:hypothetical protein
MRELYDLIFSLPPRSFTLIAVLFGFILIDDLNGDEQNALGNFIIMVGQVLETNSGQKQLLEDIETNKQINTMQETIKKLQDEVDMLKYSNHTNQ